MLTVPTPLTGCIGVEMLSSNHLVTLCAYAPSTIHLLHTPLQYGTLYKSLHYFDVLMSPLSMAWCLITNQYRSKLC